MSEARRYPVYLLLLGTFVFFFGLGWRDFWAPVEPRYAEIVRVMFVNNEWLVPTVNGSLYTDKPILYFWLALLISHLGGAVNEWTVRLPAALGGLGTVLITYKMGKDFFTARIGFIAAAVLATSVRVIWEARWAHMDMLLSCFFVLSMYFAARVVLGEGRPVEMIAAYGFMALATLTKGLIGVVLPALILLAFVIVRRDWKFLRDAHLPSGVAIFLLIAAPWFALVNHATGGRWLSDFFYIHHVERYTAGLGHREPFYYYLTTLPVDLLPWTIFALPAFFTYRPSIKFFSEPVPLFFLLWFLVVLVFFTLSDTKRDLYLLPLFPVAALLVGVYVDGLVSGEAPQSSYYRGLASVFFNLLWLACLALPIATWMLRREAFAVSLPFALMMGGGALVTAYFVWQRAVWQVFCSTALTMVLGVTAAALWVLPYLSQFKSPRLFSVEMNAKVPRAAPLYIYADSMDDFNYYTRREVIEIIPGRSELQKLFAADQKRFVLIKEKDMNRVGLNMEDRILLKSGTPGRYWYLIVLGGRR